MIKTAKIRRNDKCHCGSGRKYKVCCLNGDRDRKIEEDDKLKNGHEPVSENIRSCMDHLETQFSGHRAVDISNYLDETNYETYQIKNFRNYVFMVAEKNETNKEVFRTRGPEECNIMVMYRGAYRCFDFKNFERAKTHLYRLWAEQQTF